MRLELENLGKDPSFAHSYAPDELPLDDAGSKIG